MISLFIIYIYIYTHTFIRKKLVFIHMAKHINAPPYTYEHMHVHSCNYGLVRKRRHRVFRMRVETKTSGYELVAFFSLFSSEIRLYLPTSTLYFPSSLLPHSTHLLLIYLSSASSQLEATCYQMLSAENIIPFQMLAFCYWQRFEVSWVELEDEEIVVTVINRWMRKNIAAYGM